VDPSCIDATFKGKLIAEKLRLGKHTLLNQIEALTSRADARPVLKHMECRTLVVAGRCDVIAPLECSEEIASLLPNCTLHVFDDAGHCSPWERALAFNALLRKFLE
jgi:pimeloyl-ACP methyl ester carboxylesterase